MNSSSGGRLGVVTAVTVLMAAMAALGGAAAGTLDRIGQDKTIRIAYREDAPPFSSKDKIGEPAGFMVDLCRAVAKKLAEQRKLPSLNVAYVPVTAANRFEAITQQKADLLCEPTSATLSRRELVDFSVPTFLDGASLMVRTDGAKKLADQLHLTSLNVTYVPVTAADRFDAIRQQKADLLCEPTSATLSRRELVDFSIPTFVDGASLMIRADGPHDLKAMSGQKIGVVAGTTTEQALRNSLKEAGITSDVIPAKTHAEGLAMLDDGKISAYFADRSILVSLIKDSKAPGKLMLAENYLSIEPYALALPRGEEDFRLAVDRALSRIYRSGEIATIFKRTFGDAKPGQTLQTLYLVSALPD